MSLELEELLVAKLSECIKRELSFSDFRSDVNLISFFRWQRVEEIFVKVNQTLPFGKVTPKWMKAISNLKRQIK